MRSTKAAAPDSDATSLSRGREFEHAGEPLGSQANTNLRTKQAIRRSGGKSPRQKGDRAERALVAFLQDRGFAAERIPLSGSAGGSFVGDLTVPLLGIDRCCEVKIRRNGFRQLYNWLSGRDLLIVRADRLEPLVVLPLRLAAEIALAAEQSKFGGK